MLVAVLPLVLTSILCEALMVLLGMGVKVATLPVIALGVGIGVDYALYVLSVMLARLRAGASLAEAYAQALQFTGRVVMLTGITLALAVGTWAFSPIKFQADMGVLLAFMFLWNMVGALVLLPALARWLLRPRAGDPVQDRRPGHQPGHPSAHDSPYPLAHHSAHRSPHHSAHHSADGVAAPASVADGRLPAADPSADAMPPGPVVSLLRRTGAPQ